MINFLKTIFSKNYRKKYYRKVLNACNEYNNELEKIYTVNNII
ncbi:hypothetical protein [Clostridium sp.]|nr:hypothetical protein [Clostridium sp.]